MTHCSKRYGTLRSTCSKKVLASKALAGAATLVMTERAIRADTMVFMAVLLARDPDDAIVAVDRCPQ